MMSTDTGGLELSGPLISGSTTDLASVVEMFDSLLERSRVGVTTNASTAEDASDCDRPSTDTPDTPDTPDTTADDVTPMTSLAPMRRLQIVEDHDEAERKARYTKRRLAEPRPLSVSSTSSSSSSACSSLPRGRAWRIQPGVAPVDEGRGEGIRKSASSGSGDSGLSSPLAFVASPTSPGSRVCDPSLSYIDRVVTEVIETEAVYVNDLRQIIEGYLFYWRENPEPAIVDEHTDALFGNVQEIYRCNSVFLSALELCGLDASKVAQSFVNHGGRFAVYIDYCTKYPRTVSVLTELMRRETTARLFRERQAALGHALPLGSYLLKPVQRILKYHLLLQNMKTHTDTRTEGYASVCAALETMTALAAHINNMKKRHEHAVRVQEIQSLLYGWEGQDLTTYGELVAEGAFRMHRAKASRHVFLFDRMVLITKRREDATLAYKAHIMCSNLMLIESIPGDPYSFHVIPFDNPRLQYTLQARSMEQKRDWTLQLKRAILESYNAVIPFHARELVMQLGQDKSAVVGDTVRRSGSSKRQHSAPEYLERRRAYKRASSFNQKLRLRSRDRPSRDNSADGDEERERKSSSRSCPGDEKKGRRGLLTLRRKSEPFLSLLPSPRGSAPSGDGSDSPASDLHCLPDLDEEGPASDVLDSTDLDDSRSLLDDVTDADDVSECDVIGDVLELNGKPENLQTIVEQLVMQNMEFRRILNKPRRGLRRQSSTTKSEETDTDNEVDDDDLSFSACPEEVTPTGDGEPSALAFHSHDNTEYVSFMDYGKEESVLTPRFDTPALADGSDPRLTLQRTVSDPCRKVARKLGRMQHMGQHELLHFLGSIRRKSQRLSKAEQERVTAAAVSASDWDPLSVRRVQSFTDQDDGRPSTLSLATAALRRAASSASDPVAARAGVAYLTPQLAKKADSLPPGAFQRTGSLGRSVDFDAARFLAPHAQEEDDRLTTYTTTPAASSESLDVHPDYKIYGPAVSQSSLRSMVGSFRARLTRLKAPARSGGTSTPISSLFGSPAGSQVDMRDQSRSRLLYIMAKSLKERVASLVPDDESDAESPRSVGTIFPHGSTSLGARLARVPREPRGSPRPDRPRTPPSAAKADLGESSSTKSSSSSRSSDPGAGGSTSSSNSDRAKTFETRPDSMLSSSSVVTSSSVASSGGDSTSGVATEASVTSSSEAAGGREREESQSTSDGEGSVGSFYEHELDILEDIHGSELFRDSAIYSDPDELIDSIEATMPFPSPTSAKLDTTVGSNGSAKKIPPPVAAKPAKSASIRDRLRCLEECAYTRREEGVNSVALSAETLKSISERRRELELQRWEESGSSQPTTDAVKSISERRKELEIWRCGGRGGDESETSSQHSTSTINTVVEATSRGHSRSSSQEEETLPRGWVKQVIGKLQGESSA